MKIELSSYLNRAIEAATLASKAILEVYHSGDFQTDIKSDNSPLTIADKRAHAVISDVLLSTGLPILSEEGKQIPFETRKTWEYFWLVDPLDGTKEFLKRNGEFTVNIALIHKHEPVLGVVVVPVTNKVYYGWSGGGAFVVAGGATIELSRREKTDWKRSGLRVVASRSHMSPETAEFIAKLSEPVLVSSGSSLKFMLLAEGEADVYPRLAPTMEWDTAASHAIVKELGLAVRQQDSDEQLSYNKESLLNPHFVVF